MKYNSMPSKTVTIFGVFDGIHDGHRAFIKEAKALGDKLVAIVARDSEVEKLKGKPPILDEASRINALLKVEDIDQVFLGDAEQGTYHIIREVKPHLIFLGYDQQSLFDNITLAMASGTLPEIELVYGKAHKPETFKSSILNTAHESRD
jgi:cytidyltransferase-like protein